MSYDKSSKEWVLRKAGQERAVKRTSTKDEMLSYAKNFLKGKDANLIVRRKDGKFGKQ